MGKYSFFKLVLPALYILLITDLLKAQNLYLNQAGYLPDAPKYVLTDEPFPEEFFVVEELSSDTVFSASFFPHIAEDPATGLDLYSGNFSSFNQPGRYQIQAGTSIVTHPFVISDTVYHQLYNKSLKAFYYQRCGYDLLGPVAEPYYRTRCHRSDGFYHTSTGLAGFHPAPGGWHDAGDFGKYVVNAGITTGTLLMAYEYFPTLFWHDDVFIPESENGIPDLLDEVRYELEWLLKMQDDAGGVFFKLTPEVFAPMIMPQDDESSRYLYELSTTATGNFAAAMARSARIYASIDSAFASDCLDAAERAWGYLESNPDIIPEGGFTNPEGTITGQYGDGDDRDERLWAAAELFVTTGNTEYHQFFKDHYQEKGVLTGTMWWGNVTNLAQLTYLLAGEHLSLDLSIQEDLRSGLLSNCQSLLAQRAGNGFYVLLSPGEYVWGSNSIPLNKAILLIFGYEQTGNDSYYNAALDQLNYILGVNVHNMSFVTGVGTHFVLNPHHRPSEQDNIDPAIPGLLAGGPDENLSDPTLSSLFDSSTPPARCYIDDVNSYASNEIAINWNAPLVFVSGYFSGNSLTNIQEVKPTIIPRKIKLLPNYPNPFNGETIIRFVLPESDSIILKIYSLQGQLVYKEDLGHRFAGEFRFVWKAKNKHGAELPSGIYYYLIEGKYRSSTERLVLLK